MCNPVNFKGLTIWSKHTSGCVTTEEKKRSFQWETPGSSKETREGRHYSVHRGFFFYRSLSDEWSLSKRWKTLKYIELRKMPESRYYRIFYNKQINNFTLTPDSVG